MSWEERAACRGMDPGLFFLDRSQGGREHYRKARKTCRGCPVAAECLAEAIRNRDPFGMWGGMTPKERRRYLVRPQLARIA